MSNQRATDICSLSIHCRRRLIGRSMDICIEEIRPALPEEWNSVWRQCTYATYFHSKEWAELWSRYTGGWFRTSPLFVEFSDGKEALLPLTCEVWEGSVRGFVSSPPDTYGGWISVDAIDRAHAILMKDYMTTQLGKLDWQINPFDELVSAIQVDTNEPDETHAINLRKGFDAVYLDWSSACRRAEKKARQSGVLVRLADKEEDWRDYYRVYEDSQRRWGGGALSQYEWRLFQGMHDLHSDHLRLWLATTNEGRIVAGAVMGYARTHAVYWHGAALEEYLALRPVNLLFSEVIRAACEQGFEWFDFNSSAGLDGVRRFKESFGAKPLNCSIVHVEPAGS